ncbi:MAG: PAT family beta-lactamase induction signal transducer AmpG, partial [Myxococcota bacterium]
MLPLGFASGLPLALSGGTLQLWFADLDIDVATIGALTLVGVPYTLKFLWAPLLDRFVPPGGRRRGWLLIWQTVLALALAAMAFTSPVVSPLTMGLLAVMLAFGSASQDIVFDAYRTDVLSPPERGLGVALTVSGYRVAMVVSGGFAPMIAERYGWRVAYLGMSALMFVGVVTSMWAPRARAERPPQSIREAFVEPFRELISRKRWILPLAAIVLYKLGDAFAGTLTSAFLVKS